MLGLLAVRVAQPHHLRHATRDDVLDAAAHPVQRPVLGRLHRPRRLDGTAHPAWSDTRTPEVFTCAGSATVTTPPALCTSGSGPLRANDQEAMTDSLRVPGSR